MSLRSTEIVETIARLEDVDPVDLSPQLYQVVDPDALEAILEADSLQITFTFDGYRVTVQSDGRIQADPLESRDHLR